MRSSLSGAHAAQPSGHAAQFTYNGRPQYRVVKRLTVRRQLPAPPDMAFAWLTAYTPDDTAIFGDPPGGRRVTRISGNEFSLANRFPGTSLQEETHVIILPPDRWQGRGVLKFRSFKVAEYDQSWVLRPAGTGSELEMSVDINITSSLVRLYLLLRPGFIEREIELHYDRIKMAMIADIGAKTQLQEEG